MAVDVHAAPTMDFSNEMDEVEEYLRTKKFPASVGPDSLTGTTQRITSAYHPQVGKKKMPVECP